MADMSADILKAKIDDAVRISAKRPKFVGFLSESEAYDLKKYLSDNVKYMLWGGYSDAERPVAGFFPDYVDASAELFPIACIGFRFNSEYTLSHRDFLGSFMSLGIQRDVIGDILIGEGEAYTFVREELKQLFLDNITKIAKVGVSVFEAEANDLPVSHSYEDISGVVASKRIDCIIALLCKTSREKASSMINSGLVSINHHECLSVSKALSENDIIVVRGKGKFVIDDLSGQTKKGRIPVKCRKYK